MSNGRILSIQRAIYNYTDRYGVKPNTIFIGNEVYEELLSEIGNVIPYNTEPTTIFGIEIWQDFNNPKAMVLGYFEGVI